jgi:hypothetical protein
MRYGKIAIWTTVLLIILLVAYLALEGCDRRKPTRVESEERRVQLLSLVADPSEIEADYEATTSRLTVTARHADHSAAAGVEVYFSIVEGTGVVWGDTATGDNGTATGYFNDIGQPGTASVSATAEGVSDTVTITILQVQNRLTLSASSPVIYNDDGITKSVIRGDLRNRLSQPIVGDTVRFSSTRGFITGFAATDSSGIARGELFAPWTEAPGQAMIIGTYGYVGQPRYVVDSTYVLIEQVRPVATVDLTIFRDTLIANGKDTTLVYALVSDSLGGPIGDNTLVQFMKIGNGKFSHDTLRTVGGVVENSFVSHSKVEIDQIRVTSGGVTVIDTIVFIPGPPDSITIPPDFGQLVAGTADSVIIVATVRDKTGNLVVDGTRILFDHSFTEGNITRSSLTQYGQAHAKYTVGNTVGLDSIWAYVDTGTVSNRGTVEILPSIEVQLSLSAHPNNITVRGAGGSTETSIITATLRDANQNPVQDGTEVFFKIETAPGQTPEERPYFENVGQDTVTSHTIGGNASATLTSSIRPGTVSIRAVSGSINVVRSILTVSSGPPDTIHIGVGETYDANSAWRWQISAHVSDQHSNPVVDSTAVYFSLEPEGIAMIDGYAWTYNSSNQGDSIHGVAFTNITYSCENIFDTLTIVARCDTIEARKRAVIPFPSGSITIDANPANIYVPALESIRTSEITAVLMDDHDCPVGGGLIHFFTEEAGNVNPTEDITDENGEAQTTFTIYGYEIPDSPSGPPTVTARVKARLAGDPDTEGEVEIVCRRP